MVLSLPNGRLTLNLEHNGDDGDDDEAVKFFGVCFALNARLPKRIKGETTSTEADAHLRKIQ